MNNSQYNRESTLRRKIKEFFGGKGLDPISFLAEQGGISTHSIKKYCIQAEHGVGKDAGQLSVITAKWIIYEASQLLESEANPFMYLLKERTNDTCSTRSKRSRKARKL